jgi:spore photoproduct lyase
MKFQPNFKTIYYDKNIDSHPQGQEYAHRILTKYPNAEVVKVDSHVKIPKLWDTDPKDWFKTKNENLVLGIKKGLKNEPNQNSSDFIAPSNVNGCLASCQYCYVARHKGGGNPATVFVNIDEIAMSVINHSNKLGAKTTPNQQDPNKWIYDIGCNSDCSIDSIYSDNPARLIEMIGRSHHAKATFATKYVNEEAFINLEHNGKTRIRYSLMPPEISKKIDIRTSPIKDRVASINRLVQAGYEVHANFSPVVLYPNWIVDWTNFFKYLNDNLTDAAKFQLKCEVIFLTHHAGLHDKNLLWNASGEKYLWIPSMQEDKGRNVLRYKLDAKRQAIARFKRMISENIPYCDIRYIF